MTVVGAKRRLAATVDSRFRGNDVTLEGVRALRPFDLTAWVYFRENALRSAHANLIAPPQAEKMQTTRAVGPAPLPAGSRRYESN
jgi:hypothetical protein